MLQKTPVFPPIFPPIIPPIIPIILKEVAVSERVESTLRQAETSFATKI